MTRIINNEGLNLIKNFEVFEEDFYIDPVVSLSFIFTFNDERRMNVHVLF